MNEFQKIYNEAWQAGVAAASALKPKPMIVIGQAPGGPVKVKSWFVEDGVCGFAWVNVRPGNSPFANFLKKQKLGRKAYSGGVEIWIGDYDQSMQRKEAHARAMAEVFKANGIKAYSDSRMD